MNKKVSWGGMTDEMVEQSFAMVYKSAFKDMMYNHVREEDREDFLLDMLTLTNEYAGSTVWGAVVDLLQEEFLYTDALISSRLSNL